MVEDYLKFFTKYACYCKRYPKYYYRTEGYTHYLVFTPYIKDSVLMKMNKFGKKTYFAQGNQNDTDCIYPEKVFGGQHLLTLFRKLQRRYKRLDFKVYLSEPLGDYNKMCYIEKVEVKIY